jgi:hypothetical protein
MGENHALAPLPQRTLDGWHRFVASGDHDLLACLLSEHIVFRSPFVQSPILGLPATLLVLTTVVQIFENFRYHRTFISGSHDAALEFAANIGKWQLKGIDLITFNEAGEMTEFEDPPHQSAGRAGRGNGEPDRPAIGPAEASRRRPGLIIADFDGGGSRPQACAAGDLVARIGRLGGAYWPILLSPGTLP